MALAVLGDSKKDDGAFPPWALMVMGSVISAVLVVVMMQLSNCLTSPLPWGLSDKEKIEQELQAANEKAQMLRDRLGAQRADDARAIVEAAAAANPGAPPTATEYEELVGEMLVRTQGVDHVISASYHQTADQAAPLLARADCAVRTFQDGIKDIQKNVEAVAQREAEEMVGKMQVALGQEQRDIPQWLSAAQDGAEPPPVALIVAGLFAPVLLRMTQSQAKWQITANIILLAGAAFVLIVDKSRTCHDINVSVWIYGFLGINLLELCCQSIVIYRSNVARSELREKEERREAESTGNAVWDAYNALQNNAGQFFLALHKYNMIVGGWSFWVLKLMTLLAIGWGGFGLYVTIADVVEDSTACDAKVTVSFLHAYAFYFTMFLVIKVCTIFYWGLQALSECKCVQGPIISMAKSVDDEIPARLPVMMTLARAFMLRTKTDVFEADGRYLKQQIIDMEKDRAQLIKQANYYTEQITKNKAEAEQIENQQRSAATAEQQFVETYQARMREALDAVQPGVALLAAGVASPAAGVAAAAPKSEKVIEEPRVPAAGGKSKGKGRGERLSLRGAESVDF